MGTLIYGHTGVTEELPVKVDSSGNLIVSALLLAGEDQINDVLKTEQRFALTHISTATTTVIKNVPGFLHSVTINTTAIGTITIYDNTAASGTVLAVIAASTLEKTLTYNGVFNVGLTIVTAAASDITVSYR